MLRLLVSALAFVMIVPLRASAAGDPYLLQTHLAGFHRTAGQVGLQVVSLETGETIYEYRATDPLVPASLVKLLTSYAALKELKPSHRFGTGVYALDDPRGGVVHGNIWIKSWGDMFLLGEKSRDLAQKLRDGGIRTVRGGVFADNSFFQPQAEQICLDEHCSSSYNPVLSATAMEFNTIIFHVSPGSKPGSPAQVNWFPPGDYVLLKNAAVTGSKASKSGLKVVSLGTAEDGREKFLVSGRVPPKPDISREFRVNIENPPAFVSHSFRMFLQQAGVEVLDGTTGAGITPPGAKLLAGWESPPLSELIGGLNRYSNNFMAEMLLRSLGGTVLGPPGTSEKGIAVIRKTLREIGVPENEVYLDSGSGLSRHCRVSARAFCLLLAGAYKDNSIGPEFLSSFAVNGQEGTLRRRVCKPGIVVQGKTGTLNNVVGFAGYVSGCGGGTYAVTVILNEVRDLWAARQALDSFLERIPVAY